MSHQRYSDPQDSGQPRNQQTNQDSPKQPEYSERRSQNPQRSTKPNQDTPRKYDLPDLGQPRNQEKINQNPSRQSDPSERHRRNPSRSAQKPDQDLPEQFDSDPNADEQPDRTQNTRTQAKRQENEPPEPGPTIESGYIHPSFKARLKREVEYYDPIIREDARKVENEVKRIGSNIKVGVLKALVATGARNTLKGDRRIEQITEPSMTLETYSNLNIRNFFNIPITANSNQMIGIHGGIAFKRTTIAPDLFVLELHNKTDRDIRISNVYMHEIQAVVLGRFMSNVHPPDIIIPGLTNPVWKMLDTGIFVLYTFIADGESIGEIVLPKKTGHTDMKYAFIISSAGCKYETFTLPTRQAINLIPKASKWTY